MDKRLNEIALHHGLDGQLNQTIEECAELILEIRKYKRCIEEDEVDTIKQYRLTRICEEVVDVDIMVQQLKVLIETFDYDKFTNHQIERELTRMKEKEG